jgi:hypothetical protein
MNPFELTLGVEAKQPMDLAIIRTNGTHREGSKDTKKWPRIMKRGSYESLSFF